jgi:hypothetical protein
MGAITLCVVAISMFLANFGYLFTSEYKVDAYLRQYSINVNRPPRIIATADYSATIREVEKLRSDHDLHFLNWRFEYAMPAESHDDILRIYNEINNSDHKHLPDNKTMLQRYTIYDTLMQDFHGIDLQESIYNSSGEVVHIVRLCDVYSFYSRRVGRGPDLTYIVFRALVPNSVLDQHNVHILPIDISRDDFILFYDSLIADIIENHCFH